MTFAATAWDGLAAQLHGVAADYSCVTSTLTQQWQGPAAIAIAQAAAPHVEWLNVAATQAELAAALAKAAATAYKSALAAMAPPAAIQANRGQRLSLVATDWLGQRGPAIAAAEAEYEQMWAQDADALYAYAQASTDASAAIPFPSPPACQAAGATPAASSWALTAAPDVISSCHQVISAIPKALERLSHSPLTTLETSLSPVAASLSKLSSLSAPSDFAIGYLNCINKSAALQTLFTKPRSVSTPVITARFGRAASAGMLSVPQAWMKTTAPSPATVEEVQYDWIPEPIRLVDHCNLPPWPSCR